MAKLLTCEVALSDGTKQYYALESYVMQCLLKMAGCTNPTVVSDNNGWAVLYYSAKATYRLLWVDTSDKQDTIALIVANYLDDFLSDPSKNALTSAILEGVPTSGSQSCVTIAPIFTLSEVESAGLMHFSIAEASSYDSGNLPSSSSNAYSVLTVLHAHIRYRLAIMDDDKFKTLVEAWKTCIVKTLSGLPVTFSNEAVQ